MNVPGNRHNLIYNSHHMLASVSVIPVPDMKNLKAIPIQ